MERRCFYPDHYRLIMLENLLPVLTGLIFCIMVPAFFPSLIRIFIVYYAFAFVHYVYLQPLTIDEDFVEGPAMGLLWRRRIPRSDLLLIEEQVLSFRVIKILALHSGKSIVFFTNYYKPLTVKKIEACLQPETTAGKGSR